MTNREKSIAHDKGRAARSLKTDRAVIARQKALLAEWLDLWVVKGCAFKIKEVDELVQRTSEAIR